MKKVFIMVAIFLLVFTNAYSQSKPIMGYDQVAWGVSVNDVRRAYTIGNNIVLEEYYGNQDRNIAGLTQLDVSESISQRTFLFNKWGSNDYKLYRVYVTYRRNSVAKENLVSGLITRFGNSTDYNRVNGNCINETRSRDIIETYIFGQYSPELLVELTSTDCQHLVSMTGNSLNIPVNNYLEVVYTWKSFRDRYNSRNIDF